MSEPRAARQRLQAALDNWPEQRIEAETGRVLDAQELLIIALDAALAEAEAEVKRWKFIVGGLIDPGAYWGDWDSEEIMADIESRWAERGGGK